MENIRVARVDNVVLEHFVPDPYGTLPPTLQRATGVLHLTPHHLIFSPSTPSSAASSSTSPPIDEIWIPYPTITLLTRLPQAISGLYPLQIRTRTFDHCVLLLEKDREGGAEDVWQSVRNCAVATSVEQLYAFDYKLPPSSKSQPLVSATSDSSNGWSTYNPRMEFARQGVGVRTKAWRFTDINKDYSFCATYPSKLVVPSRISDSVLAYAGKYRSKSRIPALTYLHWANHASITRSSQPMVGIKNSRSAQDERLVECVFSSHQSAETAYGAQDTPSVPPPVYGATATNLIIDARPTTNAMANVAMGAGTENMENYKSARKAYLGIDNIHVMRNSLKTIAEALRDAETSGTIDRIQLRKSNWLRHISTILDGALVIVRNIHLNASHVLIHCSDGWDRTAQLSAVAQVCLDPYYRTFEGFKVLVEKDWLAFGHKFLDRSGHLSSEKFFTVADSHESDSDDESFGAQKAAQAFFSTMQKQFSSNSHLKEISPVFHQFLDCVRQIQRQFPTRFEFTEEWLLDLHYHLYACQFGTFLFNNERQRRSSHAGPAYSERTVSAWDHFDRSSYLNGAFNPLLDDRNSRMPDADQGVLFPDAKDVRFWHRLFKRGDDEMNGSKFALAQVTGATMLGPIGPGQADPISAEGLLEGGIAPAREPSPLNVAVTPKSDPAASVSTLGRDGLTTTGSGWNWSQLSSGALTAIQRGAREIKSISQDAYAQIRAEAGEVDGEMWGKDPAAPEATRSIPTSSFPRTTVRIPSEANPWSIADSSTPVQAPSPAPALPRLASGPRPNPWDAVPTSRLADLSLDNSSPVPPTIEPRHTETEAALGGDRKAWDPLGAL